MTIAFEDGFHWNSDRESFVFWALVDDIRKVRCVVPAEALADHFGGGHTRLELDDIFNRNRAIIEEAARRLVELGQIVRDDDIEEIQVTLRSLNM